MNQELIELSKKTAGEKAAGYVKDGMVVGLGTGSTVKYTIKKIASRIREENLNIIAIPTSCETEKLAIKEKIPLSSLNENPGIDLAVDGTDEVDKNFNLIKGGGGAHVREKIIASAAMEFVVVADFTKKVSKIGKFPVPVEVLPLAVEFVKSELIKLGGKPGLRENFTTDNGNLILDTKFLIENPEELEIKLNSIPGVVDNGIFARRKPEKVIIARGNKIEILSPD